MGSHGSQKEHASSSFNLEDEAFSSDFFRMYEFKVKRCPQARPHDWTRCPFSHPGEKAKRRDPRKFQYSGTACPEFRKSGCCRRGDACPFAHGVFECWCHPSRYRTQICTDGTNCKRRVCFFAHLESEVRKREEPSPHLSGQIQAELAAEAQIQQQEVAQAFQVLMNANAHNPNSLANLNLMNSLGMMGNTGQVPMNPLAERAQQLQQQLQQLQALQAMHMPQQQQHQQQLPDMSSSFDTNGRGGRSQQLQHELDRELLLNSTPQSMTMTSPFARSNLGAIGGPGGRMGTPPLQAARLGDQMSHAISLPGPDALRQAGIPSGLSPVLSYNGTVNDSLLGGQQVGATNALRMSRHASVPDGNALPPASSLLANMGGRSGSGALSGPQTGNPLFMRAGSQPTGLIGGQYGQLSQQLGTSPGRPPSGLGGLDNGAGGMRSSFAPQQPQQDTMHGGHGVRRSVDQGSMSRAATWGGPGQELPHMGSQGFGGELGVDMRRNPVSLDILQGLSLDDRAGSGGWLPPQSQVQSGPKPSRLGMGGSPTGGNGGLFAAGHAGQGLPATAASLDSALSMAMSQGSLGGASIASSQASAQTVSLPPGPPPISRGDATVYQNVYESQGRPPAIREDQELVGAFGMLPKTPKGDALSRSSYIGRNASFDRILAELPRSLSEVHMQQAGLAQPAGNEAVHDDSFDNGS